MKKIVHLVLFASTVALASCVDLLQEPKSNLTPGNVTWNKKTLNLRADGLYTGIRAGNYGYNCRLFWANIAADDIIAGKFQSGRLEFRDKLERTMSSFGQDIGALYNYGGISQANLQIEELSQNEDIELCTPFIAEARFVRAFSYFNLVRLFGDVPAIITVDQTDIFGSKDIVRNKVQDIYDMIIIPDLEFAIKNLSPKGRYNRSTTASIDAAKICLAEVYLTMAQWPLKLGAPYYEKAKEMALEVINSPEGYALLPDYGDLWKESLKHDRKEHIFALSHDGSNNFSNYGSSFSNAIEISAAWQDYMGDSLFFENYPADKRRDFNYVSAFNGPGGPARYTKFSFRKSIQNPHLIAKTRAPGIKKYEDFSPIGIDGKPNHGSPQTNGITSVYRLADAYFFYAEAQTQGGMLAPDDKSVFYINKIRARAYRDYGFSSAFERDENSPNYYKNRIMNDNMDGIKSKPANKDLAGEELTPDGFIKALYNERGWEFFAEFRRWFELVRTERVNEVNKNNWKINPVNLKGSDYNLLPIPFEEINRNNWINNPGWR